jgi:hypothetical protein
VKSLGKILPLLGFLASLSANAGSREINKLEAVLADARPGDMVFVDIDNTLIRPEQTLGSDQWFDFYVKKLVREGRTNQEALDLAQIEAKKVMTASRYLPVEPRTAEIVKALQAKGIPVVGLTYRNSGLAEITDRDLASAGISLNASKEAKGGVLYAAGSTKVNELEKYLAASGAKPKRILFVDDKASNTKALDDFYLSQKRELLAYRYGAADDEVNKFQASVAEAQFAEFQRSGKILADEDVLSLATKRPGDCPADFAGLGFQ